MVPCQKYVTQWLASVPVAPTPMDWPVKCVQGGTGDRSCQDAASRVTVTPPGHTAMPVTRYKLYAFINCMNVLKTENPVILFNFYTSKSRRVWELPPRLGAQPTHVICSSMIRKHAMLLQIFFSISGNVKCLGSRSVWVRMHLCQIAKRMCPGVA